MEIKTAEKGLRSGPWIGDDTMMGRWNGEGGVRWHGGHSFPSHGTKKMIESAARDTRLCPPHLERKKTSGLLVSNRRRKENTSARGGSPVAIFSVVHDGEDNRAVGRWGVKRGTGARRGEGVADAAAKPVRRWKGNGGMTGGIKTLRQEARSKPAKGLKNIYKCGAEDLRCA